MIRVKIKETTRTFSVLFLDILLKSRSNRLRIRLRAGRTASWDQSVIGKMSVIYLGRKQNICIFKN